MVWAISLFNGKPKKCILLDHFLCYYIDLVYAINRAKAMGAEVVALSSSDRKRADAKELGCDHYVVTSRPEETKPHMGTFTHILATNISTDFDCKFCL